MFGVVPSSLSNSLHVVFALVRRPLPSTSSIPAFHRSRHSPLLNQVKINVDGAIVDSIGDVARLVDLNSTECLRLTSGMPLLTPPAAPVTRVVPWQAPRYSRLKINVVGAVAASFGGAIGLVVRDSSGDQLFVTVMASVDEKVTVAASESGDDEMEILFSVSSPTRRKSVAFDFDRETLPLSSSNHSISHTDHFSKSWIVKRMEMSPLRSFYIVLIRAKINVLLPFGPLAILLHYFTGKHVWVFFFSLVGIVPLAERLGYATEQLAYYTGSTVGGLLNATFGNATEMIISIYALKSGMVRVVQQSLLGSILSNMLLVLGFSFFTGGIVHHKKVQVFNKAAAVVNSGLLLMAVMGIMFPAVLHFTRTEVHFGKSEMSLSRFSSCIMLVAYGSYLFFQLKSQQNLYGPMDEGTNNDQEEEEVPEITKWESIGWLAVLTLWISVLSAYLVDAIQGASESLNMPMAFISVILLPIVGNAAEHASAIMFAMKDKLDISLGVAIGSSTQISMFVIPFCVVVGWIMGQPMDLNFQLFETATLFITVLVVAFMLQEGTSNYFKGLMLILCYLIVAASFFVHVDHSSDDD
ncbi:Vacuolar cation/proton exchanger 2 [Linum perenne]